MSGLIQLLSLARQSLLAAQLAQQTAAGNVANAATPGYSRRRVEFAEAPPVPTIGGMAGMGVQVSQIRRLRELFLDSQFRADSTGLAEARLRATLLDRVGSLLGLPDQSPVGQALDAFFGALGDLATRPEDLATRTTVSASGQTLAATLNSLVNGLSDLKRETFSTLQDRVTEVNSLAGRIATLNGRLAGGSDPSVLDERDRLIDRLAELVGVRVSVSSNGVAQVAVAGSGVLVVEGNRAGTLTLSGDPVSGTATLTLDGATLGAPGGEVGALLTLRNSTTEGIPFVIDQVDALAAGLIHAVNRVHASGVGLVGLPSAASGNAVSSSTAPLGSAGLPVTPVAGSFTIAVFDGSGTMVSSGTIAVDPATTTLDSLATSISGIAGLSATVSGNLLTITPTTAGNTVVFGSDSSDTLVALGLNRFFAGTDARTMAVDASLAADPNRVAAAQLDVAAGLFSPGDPTNARALANLRTSRFLASNTQSPAEFLGALTGSVGTLGQAARMDSQAREAIFAASQAQRQSTSGVSLDEELADMVRFQHAFEASARFIKTMDEMIRTVLETL
ncbi:MAG: flagellar hook-associated protein FlgK [Candidatus Rokubacteria bacterium]|nr:flagellar hook-associated protein FlgK [Candidatus Rokubacteria bacterium]